MTKAAINIMLFCLTFGNNIKSIYLIRGFAREEEVYGQSDIDLLVITKDEASIPKTIGLYNFLASVFPFFDEVHGIVSYEKMLSLYNQYDLCKFRYNIDAQHWKLLYGEEIRRKFFDSIKGLERDLCLGAELCKLWTTIIQNVFTKKFPKFRVSYFLSKFNDEIKKILSFSTTVINANTISEQRNKRDLMSNLLISGVHSINEWSQRIHQFYHASSNIPMNLEVNEDDLLILDDSSRFFQEIKELIEASFPESAQTILIPQVLNPGVCAILNPRVNSVAWENPFSQLCIDNLSLYCYSEKEWNAELLRKITEKSKSAVLKQEVDVYIGLTFANFSLAVKSPFYDIKPSVQNPINAPIEFFLIEQKNRKKLDKRETFSSVPHKLAQSIRKKYDEEVELIRNMLSSSFSRIDYIERIKFFLYSMQVFFLLEGLQRGNIDFPLTSRSISRRLCKHSPGSSSWIEYLQVFYENLLREESVVIEQGLELTEKAFSYARIIYNSERGD
jgi:predicted nucleotidyltransferase